MWAALCKAGCQQSPLQLSLIVKEDGNPSLHLCPLQPSLPLLTGTERLGGEGEGSYPGSHTTLPLV